jgi:DNA-binding LytR/AlgR family response regulator
MAESNSSWLQKDNSWLKMTAHGETRAQKGLLMKTMNEIMRRLPIKGSDGTIDLIEIDAIFYLEAQGDNTLIRTKRKKPYKSVQRLGVLAKKLPAPAFVRCLKTRPSLFYTGKLIES